MLPTIAYPEGYHVYFVAGMHLEESPIKIGMCGKLATRMRALQANSPVTLTILALVPHKNRKAAIAFEHRVHNRFVSIHLYGEWFKATKTLKKFISKFQ